MIYHIAHIATMLNSLDTGQGLSKSAEKQLSHASSIFVSHLLPVNPFMQVQEFTILMYVPPFSQKTASERSRSFFPTKQDDPVVFVSY